MTEYTEILEGSQQDVMVWKTKEERTSGRRFKEQF